MGLFSSLGLFDVIVDITKDSGNTSIWNTITHHGGSGSDSWDW